MVGDLLSYVGKGYAGDMNEDYKHTQKPLSQIQNKRFGTDIGCSSCPPKLDTPTPGFDIVCKPPAPLL